MAVGRFDWEDAGRTVPLFDIPRRGELLVVVGGLMGAGKSFVAGDITSLLQGMGREVWHTSFGDLCRRVWVERHGKPPKGGIPTPDLQALGTELSGQDGRGLVSMLLAEASERDGDVVLEGARRKAELLGLTAGGFDRIWVDAPEWLRLERLRARARHPSDVTLDVLSHPLEREAQETRDLGLWNIRIENTWRPS